jgi:hypothetical protein
MTPEKETPQNLPALIKEMQERAQDEWDNLHKNRTNRPSRMETHYMSDKLVTDTANATLEYVKGVAAGLHKEMKGSYGIPVPTQESEGYNQALQDLIAHLTNNPE